MEQEDQKVEQKDEQSHAHWLNVTWRPIMAWQYTIVCLTDFLIMPILWPVLLWLSGSPVTPWKPITLEEGAYYHISMGVVIGITAWGRTQEKIKEAMSMGNRPD